MSTLIPYKLSQAVTQLSTLFISNTSDIFNHGCWCSKLVHHSKSGLGGRDFIDDLDEICKNWAKARRCLRYSAQSCENTHVEALSKFYEIDENSCVENDDLCLSEACQIDLFYISEIISRNDQGRSFKILKRISGWGNTLKNCHKISEFKRCFHFSSFSRRQGGTAGGTAYYARCPISKI